MLALYSGFLAYTTCTPDTPNFWTSSVKTPGSDSMRHQFPASDILRWFEILKSWEWSNRKREALFNSLRSHIYFQGCNLFDSRPIGRYHIMWPDDHEDKEGLLIAVEGGKMVIRDESWMILAQCSWLLLFLLLLLFLCCLGLGLSLLVLLNQLINLKRKC